jgi:hypothetical protein
MPLQYNVWTELFQVTFDQFLLYTLRLHDKLYELKGNKVQISSIFIYSFIFVTKSSCRNLTYVAVEQTNKDFRPDEFEQNCIKYI